MWRRYIWSSWPDSAQRDTGQNWCDPVVVAQYLNQRWAPQSEMALPHRGWSQCGKGGLRAQSA